MDAPSIAGIVTGSVALVLSLALTVRTILFERPDLFPYVTKVEEILDEKEGCTIVLLLAVHNNSRLPNTVSNVLLGIRGGRELNFRPQELTHAEALVLPLDIDGLHTAVGRLAFVIESNVYKEVQKYSFYIRVFSLHRRWPWFWREALFSTGSERDIALQEWPYR